MPPDGLPNLKSNSFAFALLIKSRSTCAGLAPQPFHNNRNDSTRWSCIEYIVCFSTPTFCFAWLCGPVTRRTIYSLSETSRSTVSRRRFSLECFAGVRNITEGSQRREPATAWAHYYSINRTQRCHSRYEWAGIHHRLSARPMESPPVRPKAKKITSAQSL